MIDVKWQGEEGMTKTQLAVRVALILSFVASISVSIYLNYTVCAAFLTGGTLGL